MKPFVSVALFATLFVSSLPAFAGGLEDFGPIGGGPGNTGRLEHIESPQTAAIEIRVGRYVPNVDNEFKNGATPYKTFFGDDNRYSFGLEVDWQALRIPHFGTFGPGFGLEYTKDTAKTFITKEIASLTRSGEDASLVIFPFYAVGVLRMDVVARETPVPIVPYAKLGVGGALWKISNGGGTSSYNGQVGRGLSYGPQFALGAMLLLDPLDTTASHEMETNAGVNNTYVFVEWYVSQLDGFGSGKQMQVGTNTWVLGLALEL